MKKIVLSFSLLALVLTGTISCSSDDNSSEQQQLKTLVLTSVNGTEATVNDEVTFVVTVGTSVIEGAKIEVNGKEVTNPFTFAEVGTYKVVAKKDGYNKSNEIEITIKADTAEDGRSIVGTWIPTNVIVTALGSEVVNMPYPAKENCEDDTLLFNSNQTVKFNYHSETCDLQTTGAAWSINEAGTILNLNLFGQAMTVNVITNNASKLIIKAKGNQFEALIPILVPDLAGNITPEMLGLAEVQLELNKQ
ncbi:lipocalin family protein [Myroides fluvii]|uniref:lipocalin family protein n=1 Tax=Myroides fluvii TaxID=2572594 RepID=UPI00131CAEAD|nr:lipocalin family protein [Myroides fluvii]